MNIQIGRYVLAALFLLFLIVQACKENPVDKVCPDPGNPDCPLELDSDLMGTWASVRTCPGGGAAMDTLVLSSAVDKGNLKGETLDCNDECPGPFLGVTEYTWEQVDANTIHRTQIYSENCGNVLTPNRDEDIDYRFDADTLVWGGNLERFVRMNN